MKRFDTTTKMDKDTKRIKKRQYDMSKLAEVIRKLRTGEVLDDKYRNHKLEGNRSDCYDLHIEPDWVLIYSTDDECVHLIRTGTHADLFGH
jgi:mRNA interferase YafQ